MGRYLPLLAVGVIVFQIFAMIPTLTFVVIPYVRQLADFLLSINNGLLPSVVVDTATMLTFVTGTLAVVAAVQRRQRPWSIAFVLLLVLTAYSPLLLDWLRTTPTPIYSPDGFVTDTTTFVLLLLTPRILSVILAVTVLVYSVRYGRRESSSGQDGELQIKRSHIDG